MMNTNQLLFNTNLQQQQYLQQMQQANQFNMMNTNTVNTNAMNMNTGFALPNPTSAPIPFNTMANMFATGTPNNNMYATGVNALGTSGFNTMTNANQSMNIGMGTGITMNPTMGQATINASMPATNNPNFQINSNFQTGNINLNQLYQTNQMGLGVTPPVQNTQMSITELTSLTTSTQPQQHSGLMFPTTAAIPTQSTGITFNTTVPAQTGSASKDIFDMM
jgi:hypothetical protein